MQPLPLIEQEPQLTERADAASNRRRILAAASELFAQRGAAAVSMQDVARAAGVGMGTMYRRFGDRVGLTFALLDERHRAFQEEMLHGEPPLGPGAPPRERLHAFGRRRLAMLDEEADTLVSANAASASFKGPDRAYHFHLVVLLRAAAPTIDAEFAANSLMMMLDPHLHVHLRNGRDWPLARIQDGWCALVDAWIAAPGS